MRLLIDDKGRYGEDLAGFMSRGVRKTEELGQFFANGLRKINL
jgi:hypothetical protein